MTDISNPRLLAALELAALFLRVLPVRLNPLRPLVPWRTAATYCGSEIEAWWNKWPDADIAVATGQLGTGSIFAIDLDVKNNNDGIDSMMRYVAEHGQYGDPVLAATPSGGRHMYYAYPGDGRAIPTRAGIMPGVDVRGDGGLIVVPPSVRDGNPYRWLKPPGDHKGPFPKAPESILHLCGATAAPPREPPPLDMSQVRNPRAYIKRALELEAARVAMAAPGTRNSTLFQSAASVGRLIANSPLPEDFATDVLFGAAAECGLVADDGDRAVMATIRSGFRAGGAYGPR